MGVNYLLLHEKKKEGYAQPSPTLTHKVNMKKYSNTDLTQNINYIQEKLDSDLKDDLTTVLESYMNEISMYDLFYKSIKFLTTTLYQFSESHKDALGILKSAIDDGIQTYVDNKKTEEDCDHILEKLKNKEN